MTLAAWLQRIAASPGFSEFSRRIDNARRAYRQWAYENRDQIALAVKKLDIGIAYYITPLRDFPVRYAALVVPDAIEPIVANGWYPDPDDSLGGLHLLAEVFDEEAACGNDEPTGTASESSEERQSADDLMSEKTGDKLDGIEADLCEAFPSRSPILREAFEAHRQAKFNLSVPVLIAQADGIWHDRCKKSVFTHKRKSAVDEMLIRPRAHTAAPLAQALRGDDWPLTLNEGKRQRIPDFSQLNRHQVLHGETTDYGTELNSLKAISFIRFCSFVLSDMTEDAEAGTGLRAA
ncbi:hypothetical protein [Candidatus Poriferisodalis sp.]|uniref:hypothetical protein n=1 Tax=Candidatus Poriferisodalis sp. TaxID=3101277 RepID=UPI003B5B9BC5